MGAGTFVLSQLLKADEGYLAPKRFGGISVSVDAFPATQFQMNDRVTRSDIVNSLNSFAVLLEMLTRTFLLEEDLHPQHSKLLRAVKDHESIFTSLKRSLSEAKSEWWNSRIQRSSEAYDTTIGTVTRLAQHVGGLRSGLNLQRELAHRGGKTWSSVNDSVETDALERAFGEFVEELAPPMHALTVSAYFLLSAAV